MQSALQPLLPQKTTSKFIWGNLFGNSASLVISQAAINYSGLLIVVTPDLHTANRLEQELGFFLAGNHIIEILNFPDWETLPYDHFSPHQDISAQRLQTLSRLPYIKKGILIVAVSTLMQRISPRSFHQTYAFKLQHGDVLNIEQLRLQLEHCGYRNVTQVMEHGEFAVRGSIIDLFPAGSELPFRIDLFGDEVDTLRTFDPETQLSLDKIAKIDLLPAREFPLNEDAITLFRQNWRAHFPGNTQQHTVYQDISQSITPPGIEYYLPLFFEQTETLFDYLPQNSLFLRFSEKLPIAAEEFWKEIQERYEQLRHDITRPLLAPNELYLAAQEIFAKINTFSQIQLQNEPVDDESPGKINFACALPPQFTINSQAEQPLAPLQIFITEAKQRVLLCVETPGRREVMLELLKSSGLYPKLYENWQTFLKDQNTFGIITSPLEQGLNLLEPPIVIITENQLFGERVTQRRRRKTRDINSDAIIRSLAELNIGSPIVHIDYGVGRYCGLQKINLGEHDAEFLTLEYAGGDKLYVPVSALHVISRYSGMDAEHAPLHKLGTDHWERAKRKAAEKIRDVAAELLDIYARREARQGFKFNAPDQHYQAFAAAFPFEETEDQQQAIEQVLADMTSIKPMDRLVCGDVGFGKTEVAIRAAFLAVQSGKQAAVLVPTTLLAQQHFTTFRDRFANWPIVIEMLSRFRSAKEQKTVKAQLEEGKVDILIGTHKLLQEGMKFKDLGLLIIDEEHRFGVRQKEKLKALRAEVDVLTLTATPIPRTLNMSMSGIRDLSIIATPPARRLSVKTFVRRTEKGLIREAILREILRGGQVYYVHNKVETIEKIWRDIEALVPEARVHYAHGQMPERDLERITVDFYHQRFNVLVCTTIIETGIDIPTANTIIIDRADHFGLAQLHQLRGRVGRSHHQAYAYLLIPDPKAITNDARKRLEAIAALEELGAGFTLATHDLEIRGAGELLGEEQSGHMQEIGFTLYMEMLDQAVADLKSGKQPLSEQSLHKGVEIDLQISALIPEDYLPDVNMRLTLYKRIANANDKPSLEELQAEMIDRFGLLPQPAKNLFQLAELRLRAEKLGIRKIDAGKKNGRVEFIKNPPIDSSSIIRLLQTEPQNYQMDGPDRLRFAVKDETPLARIAAVNELVDKLIKR